MLTQPEFVTHKCQFVKNSSSYAANMGTYL